jgi:glycosyltransferase involved in cell wall biosynthesis
VSAPGDVTFICGGRLVPASRFRVIPVAERLQGLGWRPRTIFGYGEADQRIAPPVLRRAYRLACRLRRAAQTAAAPGEGPLVVQRLALPWVSLPERLAARSGRPLVFDFDDAVFLGADGAPSRLRGGALAGVFRAAEHVVAGNSWLAQAVPDPAKVSVIPTCIDVDAFTPAPGVADRPVVIGWMGTAGGYRYLAQLVRPLRELRASGRRFEVVVCSDAEDPGLLRALGARFVRWREAAELETLRSFDIGLMPLEDTDWCRGKCSFKLIQYMAVGLPLAASAVGFNRDVVTDAETGFLVEGEAWFEPLAALIDDADLRRRMGGARRRRSVERFSLDAAAQAYHRILTAL